MWPCSMRARAPSGDEPRHSLSQPRAQHEPLAAHAGHVHEALDRAVPPHDGGGIRGHGVYAPPRAPHAQVLEAGHELHRAGGHLRQEGRGLPPVLNENGRFGRDAEHDLAARVLVEVEVLGEVARPDVHHHAGEHPLAGLGDAGLVGLGHHRHVHTGRGAESSRGGAGRVYDHVRMDRAPVGDEPADFAVFHGDRLDRLAEAELGPKLRSSPVVRVAAEHGRGRPIVGGVVPTAQALRVDAGDQFLDYIGAHEVHH